MDERISGNEDNVEEMDMSVKKNIKYKKYNNPATKYPEDLVHNKNSKHINNRNNGRRANPCQRCRKFF